MNAIRPTRGLCWFLQHILARSAKTPVRPMFSMTCRLSWFLRHILARGAKNTGVVMFSVHAVSAGFYGTSGRLTLTRRPACRSCWLLRPALPCPAMPCLVAPCPVHPALSSLRRPGLPWPCLLPSGWCCGWWRGYEPPRTMSRN